MRRTRALVTVAVVAATFGQITPRAAHAALGATSDFNCDGYSDLAVGVPGETVGSIGTGIVQVFFGSDAGLKPAATTLRIGAVGAAGTPANGDRFGASVRPGRLDDDTCDDLAVGAPGVNLGAATDAGAVYVFYGSASGFTANRTAKITRGSKGVPGANQAGAFFGTSLATGDADGDFIDDLAIGAPLDDGPVATNSGSVTVVYAPGQVGGGNYDAQMFREGLGNVVGTAESNAYFGTSVAFGNYAVSGDGDFSQELAIGAPGKNADSLADSGAVFLLANGANGLVAAGSVVITQDTAGVPGSSEAGDGFGFSLTSGALVGNDSYDDLVIGAPNEDIGSAVDAGGVTVLPGSDTSLLGAGAPTAFLIDQNSPGVPDAAEAGDKFGRALVAANFSTDGADVDLAISAANDDVASQADAGLVIVVRSSNGSLSLGGSQLFAQKVAGVPGASEAGDGFGYALAAGDYRGSGANDLAIGAPAENAGTIADAGAITVLANNGNVISPATSGAVAFSQDSAGVPDTSETRDRFGTL